MHGTKRASVEIKSQLKLCHVDLFSVICPKLYFNFLHRLDLIEIKRYSMDICADLEGKIC